MLIAKDKRFPGTYQPVESNCAGCFVFSIANVGTKKLYETGLYQQGSSVFQYLAIAVNAKTFVRKWTFASNSQEANVEKY